MNLANIPRCRFNLEANLRILITAELFATVDYHGRATGNPLRQQLAQHIAINKQDPVRFRRGLTLTLEL